MTPHLELLQIPSRNRLFLHPDGYVLIEIVSRVFGVLHGQIDPWRVDIVAPRRWSYDKRYIVNTFTGADGKTKKKYLHQFICPTDLLVDHDDLDRLNNRDHNLVPATLCHNGQHSGIQKNNTSGFIGVSYHKESRKYKSYIDAFGIHQDLGYHYLAEDAARRRDWEAINLKGRFVLNFPIGDYIGPNAVYPEPKAYLDIFDDKIKMAS